MKRVITIVAGLLLLGALANNESIPVRASTPEHCITAPAHLAVQCFATQAAALRVASGGRIQLAATQTANDLTNAQLFGGTSIQAILYQDENYSGSSLTIYSSTCSGWNNMPAGWNDVVSSARTSTCGVTLYELYNCNSGGMHLAVSPPGTPNVGPAMNDQASSWSLP